MQCVLAVRETVVIKPSRLNIVPSLIPYTHPSLKKREVAQHLHCTHTVVRQAWWCRHTLHLSHPWGRTLGQPVRQASALVHEGGTCYLVKKERAKCDPLEVIKFWCLSEYGCGFLDFWFTFPFCLAAVEQGIIDFLAFLIQSVTGRFFRHLAKWLTLTINAQHIVSDPADIWIWIQINLEIQIRIPDHFWLRFWPWHSLCSIINLLSLFFMAEIGDKSRSWNIIIIIKLTKMA